jgi:hypothetical protein
MHVADILIKYIANIILFLFFIFVVKIIIKSLIKKILRYKNHKEIIKKYKEKSTEFFNKARIIYPIKNFFNDEEKFSKLIDQQFEYQSKLLNNYKRRLKEEYGISEQEWYLIYSKILSNKN